MDRIPRRWRARSIAIVRGRGRRAATRWGTPRSSGSARRRGRRSDRSSISKRSTTRWCLAATCRSTCSRKMWTSMSGLRRAEGATSVLPWLLDSDPSIRWQVMRDLTGEPAELAAAERSRIASEGWGRQLLDQQRADGQWGDGVATPFWWSNMYTLVFLRDLGIDPASSPARAAVDRVRGQVTWGPGFGDSPFFEGEVEPCINGRVAALGAYFGVRSDRLIDRLLGEQLGDGGWNCEAERGSVRSSFHTTICVLEGLSAFEQAFGPTSVITDARSRAQAYL